MFIGTLPSVDQSFSPPDKYRDVALSMPHPLPALHNISTLPHGEEVACIRFLSVVSSCTAKESLGAFHMATHSLFFLLTYIHPHMEAAARIGHGV